MLKVLSIALILLIATVAVPAAHADTPLGQRIIAQEDATDVVVRPTAPTAVHPIVAQERGRQTDARLFGPANAAPVQIVGPADGFDVGDAGIGGAVALALALLAEAVVAVRGNRHHESAGAASAGN